MPCAEYARTLPVGEEPGPRGTPPSETARTERSRRRGWPGRRAPRPPSQASRGVGHRPPLPGSRAPAPAPPTPQLLGRGGARPLRSAGTHGLPCGRAGGRSRPDGVRGRAGTVQAPCGGERQQKGLPGAGPRRAARGRRVLPGLYLSWSPRCCRLGAPRARRHWQKPGTGPCLSLPPPLSARTAPRSGGARWRRGAEHAGRCSSPARLPKMAAGPGGRWGKDGSVLGLLRAFCLLQASAYLALSAAVSKGTGGGNCWGKRWACSFQSQPLLLHHPVFPYGVHWEGTPEQQLETGMLSSVKENVVRSHASSVLVSTVCLKAHWARWPVSNAGSEGLG